MRYWIRSLIILFSVALGGAVTVHAADDTPRHQLPAPADGQSKVVGLCDGETSVTVTGVAPGGRMSDSKAREVAAELMKRHDAKLQAAHGGAELVMTGRDALQVLTADQRRRWVELRTEHAP